jgi:uncharacterized integral membrane protein (TIGR00697 family)
LKVFQVAPFGIAPLIFDGGAFIFPISYIFGDILTEVYGYQRSRRVIWIGFAWLVIFNLVLYATAMMPPEPEWNKAVGDDDFKKVFGLAPRLALAGIFAYFWGEFANAYVLAKMKIATEGKWLWSRTIGSTLVGELIDTFLFCFIAFYGVLPMEQILNYTITGYLYKSAVEIMFTPATYAVVKFLKRAENEDHYDRNTDFNPFQLRTT